MNIEDLVSEIKNMYTEFEYDQLLVEYVFTLQGSYNFFVKYQRNAESIDSELSNKPIRNTVRKMGEKFHQNIESNKKFNYVRIQINKDATYQEEYLWDTVREKQDLLDYAKVFYRWLNERMMSMIFEYEKDNNLVPTQYDADGDLEYLSSWDSGVFTFCINEKDDLEHTVVLTKDGKERALDLPLKDYFIAGILEHHKITNTELANEWKPWNTLLLKALHYDIPYDQGEEFVRYM